VCSQSTGEKTRHVGGCLSVEHVDYIGDALAHCFIGTAAGPSKDDIVGESDSPHFIDTNYRLVEGGESAEYLFVVDR